MIPGRDAALRMELMGLAREASRQVSGSPRHVSLHAKMNYLLEVIRPTRK